jgi:hypothetical protein
MTESHTKDSKLTTSQVTITEEEKERRKRRLLLEWQKLENAKTIKTELDDFIDKETRSIGRRLESQSELYSPKCITCGGVGRHLRVDCAGVNWTRVVQAS